MVQLNVAVMDSKGNYVTGLRPSDFEVVEDGIPQKVATFAEGNEPTRQVNSKVSDSDKPGELRTRSRGSSDSETTSELGSELGSVMAGANVFILFDTSNYMYRGFVFAQDAIAEFVRSLDGPDRVAFYSYSRDLSRATTLTPDRSQVLRGVRTTVAGDDAALYNASADDGQRCRPEHRQKSDRRILQWSGQLQYGAARRCGRAGAVERYPDLHDQYARGQAGAGFEHRVQTHERGHGWGSVLRQNLETTTEGFRFHPKRSRPSLFAELLPASQSESRLAWNYGEAGRKSGEGLSRPDQKWLPSRIDAHRYRDGHATGCHGNCVPGFELSLSLRM